MENREVARILRETAQLLEIDGAIIGRYRSYEKAAELISSLAESVEDLARKETLTELPGIGEGLAEHICVILKPGDYALRAKLLKKYPRDAILELLHHTAITGTQENRPALAHIRLLQHPSPPKNSNSWRAEQKLREIPGFGEKSEENILHAIDVHKKISGRFLLDNAEQESARTWSNSLPGLARW